MNHLPEALRNTTAGRFIEAYRNPRLEDPEADYLSLEHIRELRDQSEMHWEKSATPEVIPGIGTIHQINVVTEQGYGYRAAWGIPETQQTDTLGLATSPLGTSAEGYNRHLMLNYMRAGNYVGFMAGEGSHRPDETPDVKTRISLASTAAALLNFGYHLGSELSQQGHSLDEENRFVYGTSRAGGVGLVTNALDSEFAQNILVTDSIAPNPSIKLDRLDQWKQVAEQLLKEPSQTALIISRLGLKLALQYRKTLSLDSNNLAHQIEICGGLFNGELNAAVTHIPSEKVIRITEYDCDLACNDGGLEQRLSPATHPNVSFEELRGIHMSIVDRNKTFPIMMGFNKAFHELERGALRNAHELHERARVLAPRQFPMTKGQVPKLPKDTAA